MTPKEMTLAIDTWVIVIHYEDGNILSEGGYKFYELGKAILDLSAKGIEQGLGDACGNPIDYIEIR